MLLLLLFIIIIIIMKKNMQNCDTTKYNQKQNLQVLFTNNRHLFVKNIFCIGLEYCGVWSALLYSFFIAANLGCWTRTEDVHGFLGTSHNFTTLEECQAECIENSLCVAIDWEPTNAGRTCWILTLTFILNTTEKGHIVHYELHRNCSS